MKFAKIATFFIAAAVGSAGMASNKIPDVGIGLSVQCKRSSVVVRTRAYTTVEVERRCRTEEVRNVYTVTEPPNTGHFQPYVTQSSTTDMPVPSFAETLTGHADNIGGIITITVTKPFTITEHGTIRTTITELILVETIFRSTVVHTNEIGETVTEIVRYTSTVEVAGGSTVPYYTAPTLETSHNTVVYTHTGNMATNSEDMTTQTTQTIYTGSTTDDSDTNTSRTTRTLSPETTEFPPTSVATTTSIETGVSFFSTTSEDSVSVTPNSTTDGASVTSSDSTHSTTEVTATATTTSEFTGEDSQEMTSSSATITPETSSSTSIHRITDTSGDTSQTVTTDSTHGIETTSSVTPSSHSSESTNEITTTPGAAMYTVSPAIMNYTVFTTSSSDTSGPAIHALTPATMHHFTIITSSNDTSTLTQSNTSNELTTTSANVPNTSLNTVCPLFGPPLSEEEEIGIEIIFTGTIDGTTYAQWLVNYASELTRQLSNVAAQAGADPSGGYTTAFGAIDIGGILGLASAAPIYACYLSSLWDEALNNPSAYAKRDISQDDKTKLIVLFERHSGEHGDFDIAELLIGYTEDLIAEVNAVIGGHPLDMSRQNARYLLSLASGSPLFRHGLADDINSALDHFHSTKSLTSFEHTSTSTESSTVTTISDEPTFTSPTTSDEPTTTFPTTSDEPTTTFPTTSDEPTTTFPTTSDEPTFTSPTTSDEPTTTFPTTSDEPTTTFPTMSDETTTTFPTTSDEPTSTFPTTSDETTTTFPTTSDEPTTTFPTTSDESSTSSFTLPIVTFITSEYKTFVHTTVDVFEETSIPTSFSPTVADESDATAFVTTAVTEGANIPTPLPPVDTTVTQQGDVVTSTVLDTTQETDAPTSTFPTTTEDTIAPTPTDSVVTVTTQESHVYEIIGQEDTVHGTDVSTLASPTVTEEIDASTSTFPRRTEM